MVVLPHQNLRTLVALDRLSNIQLLANWNQVEEAIVSAFDLMNFEASATPIPSH